jgi:hypothetical protein
MLYSNFCSPSITSYIKFDLNASWSSQGGESLPPLPPLSCAIHHDLDTKRTHEYECLPLDVSRLTGGGGGEGGGGSVGWAGVHCSPAEG